MIYDCIVLAEKPYECVEPHEWGQISSETTITMLVGTELGGMGVPGDMLISIFRCKRCKLLRFFSSK